MSSTILPLSGLHPLTNPDTASGQPGAVALAGKNPFLAALGERVRALRARRGMTRKALALAAGVSERHLANLEYGVGNASILVLLQVAGALQCALGELVSDVTSSSTEWLLIRELLEQRDEATLQRVRVMIGELLGTGGGNAGTSSRIALIGLRGAGKSTLGQLLADDLGFPFVELSREIEKFAGCSVSEIQALYGINAYRRYERRALEEAIQIYPEAVVAIPGGLVSDAGTFNQLLAHCSTVWLQADPEDHMKRVLAQGDLRPMAASEEAMADLKRILAGRAAFYSKAQLRLDTSAQPLEPTFQALRKMVRQLLQLPDKF
ncbi:MAG: helix-turn-helix transcriptional regulator [Rhodoferax sp.]|uniref:helix-turn-helix transcriptional regulator n=1 Tax=Rhodoferax sp. TaxID=50421 RepID=UPI0026108AE0|nr:helix-turn-helix transcriptional regulator [Rhodoferax sp.]MDD5333918.1 helix-turn-helix transcriptional regulator [Rhodoferax sp.]